MRRNRGNESVMGYGTYRRVKRKPYSTVRMLILIGIRALESVDARTTA